MRIDFNFEPQPSTESTRAQDSQRMQASAAGTAAGTAAGSAAEDQAQISGMHLQIQALAAQAAQLPEVREERVQSLRQAIQSGQYRASADQIASAVFDHMMAQAA